VLIDEWQLFGALWDKVRRAVDAGAAAGQFLLTGSSSPEGAGSHSGAGRIVSLRMRPMSLAERIPGGAVSLTKLLEGGRPPVSGRTDVSLEDYVEEILRSGFPDIRTYSGRALRDQLDAYVSRVVDRDFPELGHTVRDRERLLAWMRAYGSATATATSWEKIRNAATAGQMKKPSRTATGPYREVLERLFVLDMVPGWRPRNHLGRLALSPKHHLADPALAARLVGVSKEALLDGSAPGPIEPKDGAFLGALFESLLTLSVRVYAQAAEARVHHFRTHRGEHEVDLVVERQDGKVIAIEVKLAETPEEPAVKHLRWLEDRFGDDVLDSIVITTGKEAYRREDGIAVVPAALLTV
jgi:predicted AAA+ superfamily ATPase